MQLPDAPQWLGSVKGSMHFPSQATMSDGQAWTHSPPEQVWSGSQASPHLPQFFWSLSRLVQTPAQRVGQGDGPPPQAARSAAKESGTAQRAMRDIRGSPTQG